MDPATHTIQNFIHLTFSITLAAHSRSSQLDWDRFPSQFPIISSQSTLLLSQRIRVDKHSSDDTEADIAHRSNAQPLKQLTSGTSSKGSLHQRHGQLPSFSLFLILYPHRIIPYVKVVGVEPYVIHTIHSLSAPSSTSSIIITFVHFIPSLGDWRYRIGRDGMESGGYGNRGSELDIVQD